jgi:hypothetical protein
MSKSKKTIPVAKVLYMANFYLSHPDTTPEGRRAIAGMIEGILHDTGNYVGFSVLEGSHIPIYSPEAPMRHRYLPSAAIHDDYVAAGPFIQYPK